MSLSDTLSGLRAELRANARIRYLLYAVVAIVVLYSGDAFVRSVRTLQNSLSEDVDQLELMQSLAQKSGALENQNNVAEQFREFNARLYEASSDSVMKVHVQEWMDNLITRYKIRGTMITFFSPVILDTAAGEVRKLPVLLEAEKTPDDMLSILHYIETNEHIVTIEELKSLIHSIDLMQPKHFILYLNFYYVLNSL